LSKKENNYYVDNKKFYDEMVKWKAELEVNPDAPMSNTIGRKILLICQRMMTRPNFIGYSYRDEFVSDAIEICVKYAKNFDPNKTKNPFGFFSQIAYYAAVHRITKEKKHHHTKAKMVQQAGVHAMSDDFHLDSHQSDDDYVNTYRDFLRDFYDIELEQPEKKERKKKEPEKPAFDVTQGI